MSFFKLVPHKIFRDIWEAISKLPLWIKLLPVVLAVLFLVMYFTQPPKENIEQVEDPFALAEHYFNSRNSSTGEYNLKLARKYYTEAIDRGSDNPMAWHQLGRIDFLEGNYDAAIYKFEKLKSLYGDQIPNVYYMTGLTYGFKARRGGEAEDWKKAEENFLKYLQYEPESPWTRTDLSWVYFSQGKFAEMLPLLEDGLVAEPANPWLLNMYGLALMNTGKREEAHKQFLQAREYASYLTAEEWGRTYPGNDPGAWEQGLEEFKSLIEKNIELVSE